MLNQSFLSSDPKHIVLRFQEFRLDVLEALSKAVAANDELEIRRQRNRLEFVEAELSQAVNRMNVRH